RRAQGAELRAQSSGRRAQGAELRAKNRLKWNMMDDFRFEKLEIWKDSIEISDTLFDIADKADEKRYYKFAEQLRAATMSISNNIAEGSGSFSDKEFASFLNISRRSVFECANIIYIYERRKIIASSERKTIYPKLISLSKKLTNFRKALK
ncbi:MAG: four helix bundle protein, partial [Bacteroidales bacterium]|nr:four helix bundle protein [Bacteroidales bacterium]